MSKETEYGYAWENGFDCGMDKGRKQGAVEELEKILADLHSHLIYCTGKRKEECIKILSRHDECIVAVDKVRELK